MGSVGWTDGLSIGRGFAISQAFTAHPPPDRTKSQSTLDAWTRVKLLTFYGLEQEQQLNIFHYWKQVAAVTTVSSSLNFAKRLML